MSKIKVLCQKKNRIKSMVDANIPSFVTFPQHLALSLHLFSSSRLRKNLSSNPQKTSYFMQFEQLEQRQRLY